MDGSHLTDTAPRRATAAEMPVLDLRRIDTDLAGLAADLRAACLQTGFFYAAHHGVPQPVVDAVFDATRRYFAIPASERAADIMDDRFRRGWMRQGVNQHPGFQADLKESYEFSLDLPLDDPDVAAGLPLHGPNRWPAAHPWLRLAAEAYFDATMALGRRLLPVFAASLGVDADIFLRHLRKPMVQTRLFHYPPQDVPEAAADAAHQFGAAPHTDFGMMTLLTQDPVGGLELRLRSGEWVAAPFIPETFVVNLGDLFRVWTNDLYVSNAHRVVNRTGRERYSIPTFFNPDYDTPVACLPGLSSPTNPPRHAPIKAGDYLLSRFRTVQKYTPPSEAA